MSSQNRVGGDRPPDGGAHGQGVAGQSVRDGDGRGPGDGRRARTREVIIDAAAAELAETGTLTARGIAARAGVSRQAVHYHVGSLPALREELAARGLPVPGADERDTRERLVDAAVRVLSRPSGETSIAAIAQEAGLTKGAVYHHFADRRALLRAAAERITPMDELIATVRSTAGASDRDAMIAIFRTYRDAMLERAFLVRHLVAAGSRDPDLADVISEQLVSRGAPILLAWWADRAGRGGVRPLPPPLVLQALFGAALAEVLLGPTILDRVRRLGGVDPEGATEAYVDMLLEGIARRD